MKLFWNKNYIMSKFITHNFTMENYLKNYLQIVGFIKLISFKYIYLKKNKTYIINNELKGM